MNFVCGLEYVSIYLMWLCSDAPFSFWTNYLNYMLYYLVLEFEIE